MIAARKFGRVLVRDKIAPEGLTLLADFEVGETLRDPHGVIVRSSPVDVDEFENLLAVARAGVDVNKITVDKATLRGIPVFNAPGANANSVAELVFILLGCVARNVLEASSFVRSIDATLGNEGIERFVELNKKKFVGFELSGKTLCVIGLGNIGRLVAVRALERGMQVVGYDPMLSLNEWTGLIDPSVQKADSVLDAVARADVVSVHVTLNGKTRHLINEVVIAGMRCGAILMNLSRGSVCDENAVLSALESGELHSFITDFPTDRTQGYRNILCMPHLGASTAEAEIRSAEMAARELRDYLRFGIVLNSVNFPDMDMRPRAGIKMRLAIPHRNVPGQLNVIMSAIAASGANIGPQHNDTKGELGYCVVDLEEPMDDDWVARIMRHKSRDSIFDVRVLRFD